MIFSKRIWFTIICILFVRLLGLGLPIYGDEAVYAYNVLDQQYVNYYVAHPPLGVWIFNILGHIFSTSPAILRAVGVFFSTLTLLVIAHVTYRAWGDRATLLTLIILGISPWVLFGSLQLDTVGSILTFLYTLALFCYLNYLKSQSHIRLGILGIVIGLTLLTTYTGLLIFPILFFHYWLDQHKKQGFRYAHFFRTFIILGLIAGALFSLYPLWSLMSGDQSFIRSVSHARALIEAEPGEGLRPTEGLNITLLLIQYLNAFVWMGPLLLFLPLLFLFTQKQDRITRLFFTYILVVFFVFTFVMKDNFREIERYLLILAPGLCALAARFLDLRLMKRPIFLTYLVALLYTLLLFVLNLAPNQTIPFYPKQAYLTAALTGTWNIIMPLTGGSGPIGVTITVSTVMITFILVFLISLGILLVRNHRSLASFMIIALLGIGSAYSVFLSQELLFSSTGPNVNHVTNEMLTWLRENPVPSFMIFRNVAFNYYLRDQYPVYRSPELPHMPIIDNQLDFGDEYSLEAIKQMDGRVVAVVNFPAINEQSLLWQRLQQCETLKEFSSKGETIGFIVQC